MPPGAYGEFSVILRERVGCPSSLSTYEIILEITNRLTKYNGIFNVAVSRPNFIVHLATLEQQLDILSRKELSGPGYVLDIVPWSSEHISLEFPWTAHASTKGLPAAATMIEVDITDETMDAVSSVDFSYLLILELKQFYYSKVHAFLKCEEAWKHMSDLAKPFSEDLEPRISTIYKQTERQCGKEFKPQELHSHMQSCRGFKERMSSTSARPSADRWRKWPTAGHYSSESQRPSSASAVFLLTES